MAKGDIKNNIDVVNGPLPTNGANFFENEGIEPRTSLPESAGMRATNDTSRHEVKGGMPSYPKGSGMLG